MGFAVSRRRLGTGLTGIDALWGAVEGQEDDPATIDKSKGFRGGVGSGMLRGEGCSWVG